MRRQYRSRRDALVEALRRHASDAVTVHGGSAGIHSSLQFRDVSLVDTEVAAAALEAGVVARAR